MATPSRQKRAKPSTKPRRRLIYLKPELDDKLIASAETNQRSISSEAAVIIKKGLDPR